MAQDQNEIAQHKKSIEEQFYGSSDLLVNGKIYLPGNPRANGDPYLKSESFKTGTLFVKGKIFDEVLLKYNIEQDKLILKRDLENGTSAQLVLLPQLIDSFTLSSNVFVNAGLIEGINDSPQFLNKIYVGKFSLYRSFKKKYQPVFSKVNPYGKYTQPEIQYFLLDERGQVLAFKKSRTFQNHFGSQKRKVKNYMKEGAIKFGKANEDQLFNLMKYCDEKL